MTSTENDVRSAYAKLRELTKEVAPPDAKRAEIEAQVKIVDDFMRKNAHTNFTGNEHLLVGYAEMALAEGHVDLFEKVCDWCKLSNVKEESELGSWKLCYLWLYRTIHFRCPNSDQLAKRLANSKQYIRAVKIKLRSIINDESKWPQMVKTLQNILYHLNAAQAALGTFKGLYGLILDIYKSKKCVFLYLLISHWPQCLLNYGASGP